MQPERTYDRETGVPMSTLMPIGRYVLLQMLPETPASPLLVASLAPEGLTRRGTVLAVGGTCKYLRGGEAVIVRITTGKTIGTDQLVIHETACLATVIS